jgi:hypothetical protein
MRQSTIKILVTLLLFACSSAIDLPIIPPPPPTPPVLVVRVTPTGAAVMVNSSLQMTASLAGYPDASWLWSVNDTTRASITAAGLLQTKQTGNIIIQACVTGSLAACGVATLTIVQFATSPH